MARGILNDPRRYDTYFNSSGYYITGDEGYKDNQNLFWIRGRADDVINVSGHRLSTAEIESATCVDPYVSEAAVVPVDDEITGQAVCIFVVPKYVIKGDVNTVSGLMGNVNTVNVNTVSELKDTVNIMGNNVNEDTVNTINKDTVNKKTLNPTQEEIIKSVKQTLRNRIGKLVAPKNVYVVEGLPKTATGKIMRRVLRDVLSGRVPDDMSTCINVEVLKGINFSGGKVE
ncbi:acetyl-coenzyme a synthetase 2 [Vairimorpha apis BRL 01]|uniref:Acetyl-coenzyme a synthetase 2 n=1 Tax=Vairimorpha apis BRL 01 TaxID=1037528 RepID=T0LD96_9MICR|nr:acetyl-coenzyme a synthetase 2 [Vairimorpha apis BRL 01]